MRRTLLFLILLVACAREDLPQISTVPARDGGQEAEMAVRATINEHFRGKFAQEQDFLFVVDDSGSMSEEIQEVRDNLSDFVSGMQSRRVVDWQVAVTTTDAHKYQGGLVSSKLGNDVVSSSRTPNAIDEVKDILDIVLACVGNAQCPSFGNEMGLRSAQLAIENYRLKFMRPSVPLAVIVLSDEDDQSSPSPWSNEYQSIQEFVPVLRSTAFYPIVGLEHPRCLGVVTPGDRYKALQQTIGTGRATSICASDLKTSIEQIAQDIAIRGICYRLQKEAFAGSIQVSVNGSKIPASRSTGYYYENGSICFSGSQVPPEGADISVSYAANTP